MVGTPSFGGFSRQLGPFCGIARDGTRSPQYVGEDGEQHNKYMVILYSAVNAMGLYDTHRNGIAVLDLQEGRAVLRGYAAMGSAMSGPNHLQGWLWDKIMDMEDERFLQFLHDPQHKLNGVAVGEDYHKDYHKDYRKD